PVAVALSDFGLFKEATVEFAAQIAERKTLNRSAWVIVNNSLAGGDPALAWDNDTKTHWLTNEVDLPQGFSVDMGSLQTLTGMGYLPRQDGKKAGLVNRYVFETSIDGSQWEIIA